MSNETEALHRYFESKRDEIPRYISENFGFAQIWGLQRACFRRDVAINLINSFIALPLHTLKKMILWLEKIGFEKAERLAPRLPGGIPTRFQKEMEARLCTKLFGAAGPFVAAGPFKAGTALDRKFQEHLKQEIRDISAQRASTTDLLASILPIGAGYLLFSEAAQNASDFGFRLASVVAKKRAASNFFLGESVGTAFYSIFPAGPSDNEVMFATAIAVVVFAVLGVLIHVLSDPLQNRLGVHERKLFRLLDTLEMKLLREIHLSTRVPAQAFSMACDGDRLAGNVGKRANSLPPDPDTDSLFAGLRGEDVLPMGADTKKRSSAHSQVRGAREGAEVR